MLPTYYMYLIIQRADPSVGACGGTMWEETIKVERWLPFQSIPSTRRHKVLSSFHSFNINTRLSIYHHDPRSAVKSPFATLSSSLRPRPADRCVDPGLPI